MLKQKKKIISTLVIMCIMANMLFNCIMAVEFNPSGSTGDDETYKQYTAKLLDLQFNTIMALNLADELNVETPITMLGSIQINHIKDSQVELLKSEPTLELVNENGDIVATTEIYNMPDTDTYYMDIYDLNVNNNDQYKLLLSFTDNYGNEVEKYVTYDGSMFISQHTYGTMTYKSLNNIAVIEFNLDNSDNLEGQSIIKGDINRDGLVDSADAAIVLNLYKYDNATEDDIKYGDMDANGILDSADAAMILNTYKYNL